MKTQLYITAQYNYRINGFDYTVTEGHFGAGAPIAVVEVDTPAANAEEVKASRAKEIESNIKTAKASLCFWEEQLEVLKK